MEYLLDKTFKYDICFRSLDQNGHHAHIYLIFFSGSNWPINDLGSQYVHVALGLGDVVEDVGHTKYIKIINLG